MSFATFRVKIIHLITAKLFEEHNVDLKKQKKKGFVVKKVYLQTKVLYERNTT